uniref:Uncharacterized protein n=1 Tax=Knipowitschia caucasica TaxID=637954 RepID=A0AAV2MI49_KNICA
MRDSSSDLAPFSQNFLSSISGVSLGFSPLTAAPDPLGAPHTHRPHPPRLQRALSLHTGFQSHGPRQAGPPRLELPRGGQQEPGGVAFAGLKHNTLTSGMLSKRVDNLSNYVKD